MPLIKITTIDGVENGIYVNDVQTYLGELPPENIEVIKVSKCNLTVINNLSRFTNLRILDCSFNELTTLPELPEMLLKLVCYNNQLTTLPELPDSLEDLFYFNNPICDIIEVLVDDTDDISIVRNTINTLNRFRHLYYRLKFKLKFIQWFLRANETKIMEQNHPDKITALLASGVDVLDL